MPNIKTKLAEFDPVWVQIAQEARAAITDEPLLGGLIHSSVLHHGSFESALAYRLSFKLASTEMPEQILREICDKALAADSCIGIAARADIVAVRDRDPACDRFLLPLLFFKGYQAVQCHRIAH